MSSSKLMMNNKVHGLIIFMVGVCHTTNGESEAQYTPQYRWY